MRQPQILPAWALLCGILFSGCEAPFISSGTENDYDARMGGLGSVEICETTSSTSTLFAGQHIDMGQVDVQREGNMLVVEASTHRDWTMSEIHVAVASSLKKLATAPGTFPYKDDQLSNVNSHRFEIDLTELGIEAEAELFIAVHAVVQGTHDGKFGEETAWGEGKKFGVGWAMYQTLNRGKTCTDEEEELF